MKKIYPTEPFECDISIFDNIADVLVELEVMAGSTTIELGSFLKISRGAVIELEQYLGEQVDILINGVCIARGECVIVENNLAVQLSDMVGD